MRTRALVGHGFIMEDAPQDGGYGSFMVEGEGERDEKWAMSILQRRSISSTELMPWCVVYDGTTRTAR